MVERFMYLDHFGLERPPFKITPDPRLFFTGGKRGSVLDALVYAITTGEGIVKVVGEVGSGKTMLCRMLETRLPANVEIVYIANPSLSPENILQVIAFELNLHTRDAGRLQAMQILQNWLLEQHANGRQVVVFIEEAQGMPLETLEEIRLLSNLETDQSKLLQIVMFGQPELDAKLAQSAIRQLRERISHSFLLTPLNVNDVQEYLNFRMRSAGYKGPDIFDRGNARLVQRYSRGLVRRVNIIADKALLAAFAESTSTIRKDHIRLAARDSAFGVPPRWRVGYALAALLLIGLFAAPLAYLSTHPLASLAASTLAQFDTAKPHSAPRLHETEPQIVPQYATQSEANQAQRLAPAATGQRSTPAQSPPASQAQIGGEYTVQTWLDGARDWLRDAPRTSFSIQLLTVAQSDSERLQGDLRSLSELIELDKIYIYETEINDHRMLGVLYNEYATRGEALSAIDSLPDVLRQNRPFLRTVGGLRSEVNG
ncbi:MAG: AAA family ATPase [Gammaproteobacteria bacterium]|nr:AAA family ATPase [Gammaproteobacteria bacterium]